MYVSKNSSREGDLRLPNGEHEQKPIEHGKVEGATATAMAMAMVGAAGMPSSSSSGDVEAGFAKLQGEDFEYYMQTYSIVLGRNSKKSTVDVDLASLGGGMNISRNHARIFYDFPRRRFALEVIGKNGCLVEGVLHLPGNPPVKLDSQDLLQIGDKKFYFLLPTRSILGGGGRPAPAQPQPTMLPPPSRQVMTGIYGGKNGSVRQLDYEERGYDDEDGEEEEEEEDDDGRIMMGGAGKKMRMAADGRLDGYGAYGVAAGPSLTGKVGGTSAHFGKSPSSFIYLPLPPIPILIPN